MSREAFVAALTFLLAACGLVAGVAGLLQAAAVASLAFIYCQARMLQAAKGIVTWREPAVIPFMVLTGLTEGGGLLLIVGGLQALAPQWLPYAVVLGISLRALSWMHYRGRVAAVAAPLGARTELARMNSLVLIAGHLVPLLLIVAALAFPPAAILLKPVGGALVVAAGWFVKTRIVLSASYQQGYGFGRLRRGVPI